MFAPSGDAYAMSRLPPPARGSFDLPLRRLPAPRRYRIVPMSTQGGPLVRVAVDA